jgi:ATP/ADP translocase
MATLVMMLLGRTIFQKYGWGTAALITPITLLATGVVFFSLIIFNGEEAAWHQKGSLKSWRRIRIG